MAILTRPPVAAAPKNFAEASGPRVMQMVVPARSRSARKAIAALLSVATLRGLLGWAFANVPPPSAPTAGVKCNPPGPSGMPKDCVNSIANVKRYGATGNGSSDDTAAIQKAIAAGKSDIYFPSGKYLVNTCISVPSARHVYGDGRMSKIIASAAFSACAPWAALGAAFGNGYFLLTNNNYSAGNTDIVVDSISFDMSNKDVPGSHNIHLHNVTRARMTGIFTNRGNDGIALTKSFSFAVIRCHTNNHSNAGIDTWEGSTDGLFLDNVVDGGGAIGSYGILATGLTSDNRAATSSRIRIIGNTVRNVNAVGIWIQGGVAGTQVGTVQDSQVIGNHVDTVTGFHGIRTSESTRITIADNTITNVRQVGILNQGEAAAGGSTYVTIRGNLIIGASIAGSGSYPAIQLANGAIGNMLSGNVVRGTKHTWGIQIDSGATSTVVQPDNMLQAGTRGVTINNGDARTPAQ